MLEDIESTIQELNLVFNNLCIGNNMSKNEILDLIESAHSLILDSVKENTMLYIKPTFHDIVYNLVYEILDESTSEYCNKELLEKIINRAFKIFYSKNIPPRSYKNSFIRFRCDIERMKNKIEYLKSVPQPEQRTKEWYEFRHNYLTASNIWKVFISESSKNQLIYEKCCPINTEKFKNVSTMSPLHWGQKYEPVSIQWYEYNYSTSITDFGCLPHEEIDYLAASPDGINTCPKTERYGRMLEVKNIWNRVINGIPKMEYWIQMQVQMEVCKLNECDFLETRFVEYINKDAFFEDGTFEKSAMGKYKGIIMYFIKDGMPHYEYCPFQINEQDFNKWEEKMMIKNEGLTWNSNLYWRLEEISCILVLRNKIWFSEAKPMMDKLWGLVKKERIEGYEHRAPKKRQPKQNETQEIDKFVKNETTINKSSEIIIQIDTEIHSNTECEHSPKIEHSLD